MSNTLPPAQLPDPDEFAPLDFLVVAPHPDDAELGMGGTIMRMLDQGMRVGVLDLTSGEPTPHGSMETRVRETATATEIMKLTWRGNAGLVNRTLENTIEARERIAGYVRCLRPRWLFAPYYYDAHPDHLATTLLTEAARFHAKLSKTDMPGPRHHAERLYYYFSVHLRLAVQPAWIVDISEQWERKMQTVRAFESQMITGRSTVAPTVLDRIRQDGEHWGRLIDRNYGEPFGTKEPLAMSSLRDLL